MQGVRVGQPVTVSLFSWLQIIFFHMEPNGDQEIPECRGVRSFQEWLCKSLTHRTRQCCTMEACYQEVSALLSGAPCSFMPHVIANLKETKPGGGSKWVSISRHKQVSRFTQKLFIYGLHACFSHFWRFSLVTVKVTVDISGGVCHTVKLREKNGIA